MKGKVDFLFPSHQAWKHDWRRCVIVSIKRSLRERYKQVFEELSIAQSTVYLFVTETYEEAKKDITAPKVRGLNEQNVYLVVRDEIKNMRFSAHVNSDWNLQLSLVKNCLTIEHVGLICYGHRSRHPLCSTLYTQKEIYHARRF